MTAVDLAPTVDDPTPIVAWTVRDWARQTGLSKSYIYILLDKKRIRSKKSGKRRLITTPPREYINSLPDA